MIVLLATPAKNASPPQNLLALSLRSPELFYVWTVKFVRVRTFESDMRVFRLQAKDRRHHLSQSIGPAIAAGLPDLPRHTCVVPGQLTAFLAIPSSDNAIGHTVK